jgi:hypothetical protein
MTTSPLTFRITLWRPWLLAVVPLAVLAALGVAVSIAMGERAAASALLLGFAGLAVVLLLAIGLTVRANRWHVDPNGIGGRNNWLAYRYLAWPDIESIEPWLLPEYPYLQHMLESRLSM